MTAPRLAPDLPESVTVHMVLDDLGRIGRVWREADVEQTREIDVVQAMLDEQFSDPLQVVAFNLVEGWCRDVSEDVARAVADLARKQGDTLGPVAATFYERSTGDDVPRDVARVD